MFPLLWGLPVTSRVDSGQVVMGRQKLFLLELVLETSDQGPERP